MNSTLGLPDEVFTVRGRPVAFCRTRWGGELRAIERGPFPVSPTGYRSLSCGNPANRPTGAQLELLAVEYDRENAGILRSSAKAISVSGADSLSRYIHAQGLAHAAVERGFFASDDARLELWHLAFRIFSAIAEDPRLQPRPIEPAAAWTAQHCDRALHSARKTVPWLASLLAGDIAAFPTEADDVLSVFISARSYLALPSRQTPEPCSSIPALTQSFAFDAGAGFREDPEEDPADDSNLELEDEARETPSPTPPTASSAQTEQLCLF